jgi:hypothetical protein
MLKILLLVLTLSQCKEVTERGGLIFKYEGNAQINQDFVQYSRLVDTTALFKVAQTLADSSTLYSAYCEVIDEVTSPSQDNEIDNQSKLKYFHTPLKYMIKEALGVCQRLSARLPEIRNKQTQNNIRSYANLHDISRIAAGITYNQQLKLFTFNSDGANA